MYLPPRRPTPVFQKIIHLPKSRLDKLKAWLFELKQGLRDFFAAAPLWQWILGSMVIFGAFAFFKGYFPDFWRSFNPLYR